MYIEPNSTIKLYKGIPLKPDYNNTIYFESVAYQNYYFHTGSDKIKYMLSNQSYQRVNRGYMRIEKSADDLYDCNYLAFQNTSYGSKWFYAFIISVEYVNNNVAQIEYQIDVMQTYAFDYTLKDCFVEREHSLTDNIGDNILPEPVDGGEYVYSEYEEVDHSLEDLCVLISIVFNDDSGVAGRTYDGVYGGTRLYVYDQYDTEGINSLLREFLIKPDSIVDMYMCPKFLIGTIPQSHLLEGTFVSHSASYNLSKWNVSQQTSIDGYEPKNKKLFTYPYNYFGIDNANGKSLTLRYEKFRDLQPAIQIFGTIKEPVTVTLRPCNYKGSPDIDVPLRPWICLNTESINLDNYPLCSWNFNAFSVWLGQNSIPMAIGMLGNVATMGFGGGSSTQYVNRTVTNKKPVNGRLRTTSKSTYDYTSERDYSMGADFSSITATLSSFYTASIQADICKGNTSSSNVNVAHHKQNFWCARVHIDYQHAMMIDNFFNMYGYTTNLIKEPNINSRPHWNYVKTNGCNAISKSMPSDDLQTICNIFDNGITFWKDPTEIGDYSLDNSPE